jgi:hypothetical protein
VIVDSQEFCIQLARRTANDRHGVVIAACCVVPARRYLHRRHELDRQAIATLSRSRLRLGLAASLRPSSDTGVLACLAGWAIF